MAAKPASIWQCDTCGMTAALATCPKRLKCRYCAHWMTRVYPR